MPRVTLGAPTGHRSTFTSLICLIIATLAVAVAAGPAKAAITAQKITGSKGYDTYLTNNGVGAGLDSAGCTFLGRIVTYADYNDGGDIWENAAFFGQLWSLWVQDSYFGLGTPFGWGMSNTMVVEAQLLGGGADVCSWVANLWLYDWTGKQFDVISWHYIPPNGLIADTTFDDNGLQAYNPGGSTGTWYDIDVASNGAWSSSTDVLFMGSIDQGPPALPDPSLYNQGLTPHKLGIEVWNVNTPRTYTTDNDPNGLKAIDIVMDDRMCAPNGTYPWHDCAYAVTGPTGIPGFNHVVVN